MCLGGSGVECGHSICLTAAMAPGGVQGESTSFDFWRNFHSAGI